MASDGPSLHSPSLCLGLPAPQPSLARRHHAHSLLGPAFHDPGTHHHDVLESTPSKPRLSPAATMSDDTISALTPSLHCASILQPATPPQVVAFESYTISAPICLNRFTFADSWKSDLWTCVCVLPFPLLSLLFDRNELELVCIYTCVCVHVYMWVYVYVYIRVHMHFCGESACIHRCCWAPCMCRCLR